VLAAQQAAFAAIAPGRHFMEPHDAAVRVLTRGLVDLKLLAGDVDALIERGAYKRFYMHGTGHWLGLDVHDAGTYKTGGQWTVVRPGMTLTVEPGCTSARPPTCPTRWPASASASRTTSASSTAAATSNDGPKTVADIEEVMRHD
jgi:Xaa-Pro aminopeptidase